MDIRGRKMKKPPACVQCRKRKIGCDRVKPICGNCLKNGKTDCFFPDVPGQYVPSNSSLQNSAKYELARENAAELHHNPELASMEQIREYNTRLQLLNAQQHRTSPGPMETAQFIPRTVPTFENKPVSSANGSALHLNWVQGPAMFDIMTSPYTQEEVLLKEMDFLRSRLLELQEITGTKAGVNLSDDLGSNGSNSGGRDHGGRDQNGGDTPDYRRLQMSLRGEGFNVNEFRDLDPEFLDAKQVFDVFTVTNTDNLTDLNPLSDAPNCIFNVRFLTIRDEYLAQFYRRFNQVAKDNFNDLLTNWRQQRSKGPSNLKNDQSIRFPPRGVTQEIITKYLATVTDTNSLIPILKPRELSTAVEQLFGREPIFSPNKLDLPQIATLGQITVCLLLTYETLSSSVLIPLRDEQLTLFHQLRDWVPSLMTNLHLIRSEIDRRDSNSYSVNVLNFIAIWKYYQSVADTSDSDSADGDEDVHMARLLSLNHESKNQLHILLWNFIFKNYCWRHLFKGEIPSMVMGSEQNSATVIDPLLNNDFALLTFQIDMLKYLQTKDSMVSLPKVLALRDLFKVKLNDQNKKCYTTAAIITSVVDSLIYRNAMLFINYYLLMQYEKLGDADTFADYYKEFLQLVQETLFYVFSNLANLKFAGYEFIFAKKSFQTLENICSMILGLYQRCYTLLAKNTGIVTDNTKAEGQQAEILVLLLKKILMLLQDYAKNRKAGSPLIFKLVCKLRTTLEYIAHCESSPMVTMNHVMEKRPISNSTPNAFELIDDSDIAKVVTKLRGISESLIKSDFYNQRKPYQPTNPQTIGLTAENFSDVFNSLYS